MKKVVIESPYMGANLMEREKNRRYAIACMQDAISKDEAPYASHLLYTQFLNEDNEQDRQLGIEMGLLWGRSAEKVVIYTDLGISKGMQQGIKRAIEAGKEVEYRTLDDATCYTRYDFNLQQIAVDVAERFGIGHADLKRRCNERKVSDVRHVFCAIAKTVHPEYSLKTIGSSIDRDHCTVINSLKTVRNVKELQLMYFEFCLVKRIQPDNYVDKAIEKRKILSYAGHV